MQYNQSYSKVGLRFNLKLLNSVNATHDLYEKFIAYITTQFKSIFKSWKEIHVKKFNSMTQIGFLHRIFQLKNLTDKIINLYIKVNIECISKL